MQSSGKNRSKYKLITETEETPTHKGRNFALISGVTCAVIVVVYLIVAAYPSRLFSEQRNPTTSVEEPPIVAPAHPELPPSALKTSSEETFASTTHVMTRLFAEMGKTYKAPSLQLFEDTISAYQCGQSLPATGPFYCAADKQVFLDLTFFRAVKAADTTSGNNVQAYLIAHQVGHHIEDLLGITAKINAALANADAVTARKLNSKAELLADYYAGVWAHYTFKKDLDNGDTEILINDVTKLSSSLARNTEKAVGDPYNYANLGNRAYAFYHGYQSGSLKKQDVFEPGELK
jgi:predicted metalloprotease